VTVFDVIDQIDDLHWLVTIGTGDLSVETSSVLLVLAGETEIALLDHLFHQADSLGRLLKADSTSWTVLSALVGFADGADQVALPALVDVSVPPDHQADRALQEGQGSA
jgi:putative NADH-flavin reductase